MERLGGVHEIDNLAAISTSPLITINGSNAVSVKTVEIDS